MTHRALTLLAALPNLSPQALGAQRRGAYDDGR